MKIFIIIIENTSFLTNINYILFFFHNEIREILNFFSKHTINIFCILCKGYYYFLFLKNIKKKNLFKHTPSERRLIKYFFFFLNYENPCCSKHEMPGPATPVLLRPRTEVLLRPRTERLATVIFQTTQTTEP